MKFINYAFVASLFLCGMSKAANEICARVVNDTSNHVLA